MPSPFQKWYEANKKEFNAKRKKRYDADPEYKRKALERQDKYRQTHPKAAQPERKHFRDCNGTRVEVYRIGTVAELIGRKEGTIRKWERQEIIPAPSIKGKQRYYTMHQIKLMKDFVELMDQVRYDPAVRALATQHQRKHMHALWEGN